MTRIIMSSLLTAVLFPTVIAAPSALAQGGHHHYAWCLRSGGGLECAFNTLKQCRETASGRSLAGCVRNSRGL